MIGGIQFWIENKGVFTAFAFWSIHDLAGREVSKQEIEIGQSLTYAGAVELVAAFQASAFLAANRLFAEPGPFSGPPVGRIVVRIGEVSLQAIGPALVELPRLENEFREKLRETQQSEGAE